MIFKNILFNLRLKILSKFEQKLSKFYFFQSRGPFDHSRPGLDLRKMETLTAWPSDLQYRKTGLSNNYQVLKLARSGPENLNMARPDDSEVGPARPEDSAVGSAL